MASTASRALPRVAGSSSCLPLRANNRPAALRTPTPLSASYKTTTRARPLASQQQQTQTHRPSPPRVWTSLPSARRMASSLTPARAIVASAPGDDHVPGANWALREIAVPTQPGRGEVLVQMVASGICHTDLLMTSAPPGAGLSYPWVAGHEGSGIVRAVGPGVTAPLAVGDPVLLSFDSCRACHSCETRHPAYCSHFFPLNLAGVPGVFRERDGEGEVVGQFFGQSSFASLSVVKEASILPVKDLVHGEEELRMFSPLGCGVQTGAGSILNVVKPLETDRIMVLGLGGVGLGAVMGAAIAGCKQIIAVDRVESRIQLAKSFGATHGVNTTGLDDFKSAFLEVTNGLGPSVCIETTAFTPLLDAGFQSLGQGGSFVFIGASPNAAATLDVNIQQLMLKGIRVIGCIEGDAIPAEFLPRLIKHYREGKLPIDKIVKYYKAEDFKTALHDMHTGETIKPVLVW